MISSMRTAFAALSLLCVTFVAAQTIPRPAIAGFTVAREGAKPFTVGDYKGKVIAFAIILTTCSHCQETCRLLTKLNTELGPRGFQPLAAAINEDPQVPRFIHDFHINFPVGTVPRETVYGFLEHSMMNPRLNMPQMVFIDRAGMVRAQYAGEDGFFGDQEKNMRDMVIKLLAEPTKKRS
jgi:hypothetical protein